MALCIIDIYDRGAALGQREESEGGQEEAEVHPGGTEEGLQEGSYHTS